MNEPIHGVRDTIDCLEAEVKRLEAKLKASEEMRKEMLPLLTEFKKRLNPSGAVGGYLVLDSNIYTLLGHVIEKNEALNEASEGKGEGK